MSQIPRFDLSDIPAEQLINELIRRSTNLENAFVGVFLHPNGVDEERIGLRIVLAARGIGILRLLIGALVTKYGELDEVRAAQNQPPLSAEGIQHLNIDALAENLGMPSQSGPQTLDEFQRRCMEELREKEE